MTIADPRPQKECPFCAEMILSAAKKCKYCGEFLDTDSLPPAPEDASAARVKCTNCSHLVLQKTAEKHDGLCALCAKGGRRRAVPQARNSGGALNSVMICPHCHTRGSVRTNPVKQKAGISGGKATAALLTGGLSLLVVGLSRKENKTEARCVTCGNTWFF